MNGDFRLDGWLVQPQLNSVCNANEVIRLEPKVMQVLVQLALHPDEVMTKGQLIEAVWPDTHVGEHVLTRCVSELRRVFGEDARVPRYIQNVPKVGYRLIAPVLPAALAEPPQLPQTSPANLAELPPRSIVEAPVLPEHGRLSHGVGRRILWATSVLTVLAVVGFLSSSRRITSVDATLMTVPFTSYPGSQTQPSFSPDGKEVALFGTSGATRPIFL